MLCFLVPLVMSFLYVFFSKMGGLTYDKKTKDDVKIT